MNMKVVKMVFFGSTFTSDPMSLDDAKITIKKLNEKDIESCWLEDIQVKN